MPFPTPRVLRQGALGAAALAAVFLAVPSRSLAAVACRSDPIVILSNGIVLDLSATINDTVDDVTEVRYTLHVPSGIGIVTAISTDGAVGYRERFAVQADSAPGTYSTVIRVKTGAKNTAITANIAGGFASELSITPAMVGQSSFTWTTSTSTNEGGPPDAKGPKAPATLPATVTAALLDLGCQRGVERHRFDARRDE